MSVPLTQKKKKQFALIAVLLVVLLIAVLTAPQADTDGAAPTVPAASLISLKSSNERQRSNGTEEAMDRVSNINELPRLEDETDDLDLFQQALVATSVAPDADPAAITPRKKIEYKVGAIYGTYQATDQSALIDGKIVKPGGQLASGERVISVSAGGVTVAP